MGSTSLLILIGFSVFLTSSLVFAKNAIDPDWYAFSFDSGFDSASAANLGKLSLDAPAGKYGFLQVKNAGFYFGNEQRVRFWGINLCQSACFPDKAAAKKFAADLAFLGFNCVRLSGLDFDFSPQGIFEDIGAEYKDSQLKTTRYVSIEQLDKLDYLISQLKAQGIYICLNLLSDRKFTQADGIVDAELLEQAAGPAAIFDDDLIDLQKEYALTLLNHFNKYTKLKYNQDPAIALIEITDKNSLLQAWENSALNGNLFGSKNKALPGYYSKQLDFSWNEYLRKKYTFIEKLKAAWQENSDTQSTIPLNQVTWNLESNKQAKANVKTKDNLNIIKIRNISGNPQDLQFRANCLNLFKNKKYLLSFTISAEQNTRIGIIAEQVFSPWDNLGLDQQLEISPVPQIITLPFSPEIDCANARVSFIIGQTKGTINIADLELKPIDSLPIIENDAKLTKFKFHRPLAQMIKLYPKQAKDDIIEFYTQISAAYFKNMADFLKTECAVKVPITGIASYSQPGDIDAQTACDYISTAAFWDYPEFNQEAQAKTGFKLKNNSVLMEKDLGILGLIQSRDPNSQDKKTKPFISNWSHCFPNKFSYESPTLLGSVAGNNNWDGLFQYAYSLSSDQSINQNMINHWFEIINNPQQLLLCAIAGLAFNYEFATPKIKGLCGFIENKTLRAGSITAKSADDGAVFLCALDQKSAEESAHFLLIALSEIKNTNSGWGKTGFNWGTAPTLLKKINLDIKIPKLKAPTVYVLDNSGKRLQKVKFNKVNTQLSFNTQDFNSPWFEIVLNP
ncbi:MAG: hypothetical protein KKD05_05490 [Candidatus Omnitrophica bacterium]|nr:hypothetical protein [Candidatus Omnitrophota bacterium]